MSFRRAASNIGKITVIRVLSLTVVNAALINSGFIGAFFIRCGMPFPERNFLPYEKSGVFITIIYLASLAACGAYRSRFKSSWDLFKRVFLGLSAGTTMAVAFLYVLRVEWGAFPSGIFVISFFINLVLVFKCNQAILRNLKRIRKKIVVIGEDDVDELVTKKADVERRKIAEIEELASLEDVDEIIICEKISNGKNLNLLIYLVQKLKISVVFSPASYLSLLPEKINGNNSIDFLATFLGKKAETEEFFIRAFDVIVSFLAIVLLMPLMILVGLAVKLTSKGPILYTQKRVGKDGKIFTLYKYRTMYSNAEELYGFQPAEPNDQRITPFGRFLRKSRIDELPQLANVLEGTMSLIGPRPENLSRVRNHKALQSIRLAVKPGLTGLAQIRGAYDLHPRHKVKYDYLYIQRRSFALNLYILLRTVPVVLRIAGR